MAKGRPPSQKVRQWRASQGGKGRAAKLTPEERQRISQQGGQARWQRVYPSETKRLPRQVVGAVSFADEGDTLLLMIENWRCFDLWTEAHVDEVMMLLQAWRRRRKAVARARARRQGGKPLTPSEE